MSGEGAAAHKDTATALDMQCFLYVSTLRTVFKVSVGRTVYAGNAGLGNGERQVGFVKRTGLLPASSRAGPLRAGWLGPVLPR